MPPKQDNDNTEKTGTSLVEPSAKALGPVDPAAFAQMQTALAAVLDKLEAKDKQIKKLSSSLEATIITAVTASETTSVANTVPAASINLPKMWLEETELWFAWAEATFAQKNITWKDTKYNHVVGLLDTKQAGLVNDTLTESPAQPQQYICLKQRLLVETTLKLHERAHRLLNMKGLVTKRQALLSWIWSNYYQQERD